MPQPPFRVDGAVDGIDHDACLRASERALAELLGDQRELNAVLMELLEPRDDDAFSSRVDDGRVVASDACGEHGLPLGAGGKLVELRANVGSGRPADVEPRFHS